LDFSIAFLCPVHNAFSKVIGFGFSASSSAAIIQMIDSLNCVGDSVAAIAVAKSENKLDENVFNA